MLYEDTKLYKDTKLMADAQTIFENFISPYRDYDRQQMEDAVEKSWPPSDISAEHQPAVIYIGACFPNHSRYPKFFADLAKKRDWDTGELVKLGSGWYMHTTGDPIPHFVRERSGDGAILRALIEQAPDDSTAYITAARVFFSNDLTTGEIDEFRSLWDRLPEDRREAISVALGTDERCMHHPPDLIVIQPTPSKIDLVTYANRRPSAVNSRSRWTDRTTHALRHRVWSACAAACLEFAKTCASAGDERGQIGALLEGLRLAPRVHITGLQDVLKSSRASLTLNHYVFSAAEENLWGPDFAFLFSYNEVKGLSVSRYIQFQAKLVKNGTVRIPKDQLASLLQSSWHSSFYVMWAAGMVPRTIHAPLLKELVAGSSAATPSVPWSALEECSDLLSALIGDRILCAELGDDPNVPEADPAKVSQRMGDLYGRPRYGILSLSVEVGSDQHGDGGFGVVELGAQGDQ